MTRTLPWLNDKVKEKAIKKQAASSSRTPKRDRDSSPENLVDLDLNPIAPETPPKKEKKRAARTPSTSPPPAPPDVEYMHEGYGADDQFMMVEDEFLSVAKTFTQHLHHAEYVRFKKLARSRGADVLEEIQRPVDGKTAQSKGLRLQLEAEERSKRVKKSLKGDEDESSGEDEFAMDPQLAGLMLRTQEKKKDLFGMLGTKANTRAAAGFEQSPRNFERSRDALGDSKGSTLESVSTKAARRVKEEVYSDEEEDDLDAAHTKPRTSSFVKPTTSPTFFKDFTAEKRRPSNESKSSSSGIFKQYARRQDKDLRKSSYDKPDWSPSSRQTHAKSSKSPDLESISPNSKSATASEYLAKRRAERERKEREQKRKAKNAFDIPTFAI